MPARKSLVSTPLAEVDTSKMDRYWSQFLRSPREIKLLRLREVLEEYTKNQDAVSELESRNHAIAESLLKFLRRPQNRQLLHELEFNESDEGDMSFRFEGITVLAYPRFFISFEDARTIEGMLSERGFNPKDYYALNQYALGRLFKKTKDPVTQELRDMLMSRSLLERKMMLQVRNPNHQMAKKNKAKPQSVHGFTQAIYLLPGKGHETRD